VSRLENFNTFFAWDMHPRNNALNGRAHGSVTSLRFIVSSSNLHGRKFDTRYEFNSAREPVNRSADFQSASICRNRRGPRRFCGARFPASSPHDAGVGRGAFQLRATDAPPLPGPLLHPMEERECLVAALPRCAVSRISNPPGTRSSVALEICGRPAEWNSAIQQIGNLRYE